MIYETKYGEYRVVRGRFFYRAQHRHSKRDNWRSFSRFHFTKEGALKAIWATQKRVTRGMEFLSERAERENKAVEV